MKNKNICRYREKKKKRKDAKSLAKTKEIDADTDEQIELIPFGEVCIIVFNYYFGLIVISLLFNIEM